MEDDLNCWTELVRIYGHFGVTGPKDSGPIDTRLDKHWSDQPLLYDFKDELVGTGD